MSRIATFPADFPGAIVYPVEADNAYAPAGHGNIPNQPRAFVMHTPEEPADGHPGTPYWFAQYHPAQRGSTHYFVSYVGQVWQCVPERWGAIANGLNGKPKPSWAREGSLNWQTLSVEIEGYAHSIHETLIPGGLQWQALVELIRHRCGAWKIPADREHLPGHYQLSVDRSDPGAKFPWDRLMADVGGRMPTQEYNELYERDEQIKQVIKVLADRVTSLQKIAWDQGLLLNKYEVHTDHPPGK